MNYERLLNILRGAGRPRVLLVGDFMLDRYLYGDTDRISPEAPVLVMNVKERRQRPGGAGSVAVNLSLLGCEVHCFGVIGSDPAGSELISELGTLTGVQTRGLLTDPTRHTTVKGRLIGLAQHRHQQQLMRLDEESRSELSENLQAKLLDKFCQALPECDVVCLEDYNKGLFSPSFCRQVIDAARAAGKKVILDPASIGDYGRYRRAWLVKPNRREVAQAAGLEAVDEAAVAAGCEKLCAQYDFGNLVVTLDKQGAFLYEAVSGEGRLVPTRPRDVYDVTGAGDMVLAMLGLLIGASYDDVEDPTLEDVVQLANIAGGLEVEHYGCVGIPREDIVAELMREGRIHGGKLRSLEVLVQELAALRQQGRKIVFTNGCFDILHSGHVDLLRFARQQGDILIVGLNSDVSVRGLKGPGRPINDQHERAELMGALEMVDYVTIFDESAPGALIEAITPDVLIKGSDWQGNVVGQEWVESHGGRVALMPLKTGHSTTNIIERVRNSTV